MSTMDHTFRTHVEVALDGLGAEPGTEVLVHDDRRLTGGELRDLVYRMARDLLARGLGRGGAVTLLSGNRPEVLAARYAANLIGCRVSDLSNGLSAEAQADIVRDLETDALIVDPRLAGQAGEVTRIAPVKHRLFLGPGPTEEGKDLLASAAEQSAEPFPGLAQPEDVCTVRFTGGTTGRPKGVPSTFRSMLGRVRDPMRHAVEERDLQLVCTPLTHLAGYMADQVLAAGGLVVLLQGFDASEVLTTIERERITSIFLLPPMLYRLIDHPDAAHRDLSSLRNVMYSGSRASAPRIADAVRRLGPVLVTFYGQSEAGGISMLPADEHDPGDLRRLRTVGRPNPGVSVAIRDEAGHDLPTGEHGEIFVRTPNMMIGYWKRPDLTAEVLRDGWLSTGDVGFLDEDGYLTLTDRARETIDPFAGGNHIYPSELEDVLNDHPGVRQSAVYGVRRADDAEERIHAAVVPTSGAGLDERRLQDWMRERRGPMYVPARITFTDVLPLTDAGKPDKNRLRAADLDETPDP